MELRICCCFVRKSATLIYFSLNVRDQDSHPYKTRQNSNFILIFVYDFGTILKAKIKIKAQLVENITLIDNHKHYAGYARLFTGKRTPDFRQM